MKNLIKFYSIALLGFIGFILMCCEAETLSALIWSKIIGLCIIGASAWLYKAAKIDLEELERFLGIK